MSVIAEPGLGPMHTSLPGVDLPDPSGRLRNWILAYEARVVELAEFLDEGWLRRRFGAIVAESWRTTGHSRRRALVHAWVGRPAPTVAGLLLPANRLALLPAEELHLVLRARALFARATTLRRCVDGRLLERIAAGLGKEGGALLAGLQRCAVARADEQEDLRLLSQGEPEDWARDGLRRFVRDGAWTEPALAALVRMSLPPAAEGGPALGAASDASRAFLDLLPNLIPETSWLFG